VTPRYKHRDRLWGVELGAVDYVTMPFNVLELAPRIQGLLERIGRGEREELRREKLAEARALVESDRYGPTRTNN
jgi:DNA-binding response OmpR family regulator